jgi:polyhydroxyalkanoate synthase
VSEPGHPQRSYQIATKQATDKYEDPERWVGQNHRKDGSWWPAWTHWLAERSGEPVAPPSMGEPRHGYAPSTAAPGIYVLRTES